MFSDNADRLRLDWKQALVALKIDRRTVGVYLAAFVLFVVLNYTPTDFSEAIVDDLHALPLVALLKIYVPAAVFAVLAFHTLLAPGRIARYAAMVLMGAAACSEFIYWKLHPATPGFNFADAQLIISQLPRDGAVGQMLTTYGPLLIGGLALGALGSALLFVGIEKYGPRLPRNIYAWAPFVVLLGVYTMVAKGGSASSLPAPAKIPVLFAMNLRMDFYFIERKPVELQPTQPHAGHLIYLVDESVRGDVLQFNGYATPTTPYLDRYEGTMVNYGVASAATNCSASSNIFLQTGMMPADMGPDFAPRVFSKPTLFQYAKRSGYRTIYIDGQIPEGFQNYMRTSDTEHIDDVVRPLEAHPGLAREQADRRIADHIARELADAGDTPVFFYVVKNGAHFPYEESFPVENSNADHRDLDKNYYERIKNASEQEFHRNYLSAVTWSVDGFFEYFFEKLDGRDVTILYTSDHGQSSPFGNASLETHCSTAIAPSQLSQALVPMVLFGLGDAAPTLKAKTGAHYPANVGKTSHFNLFATALELMGYGEKPPGLEPSLFDTILGSRITYSGVIPGYQNYGKVSVPDRVPGKASPPVASPKAASNE